MAASSFWPGEKIPTAGVYSVVHTNNHVVPHEVTIAYDGEFPPCQECGPRVYFTLTKAGQNIASNPHFRKSGR
jgi:hypothetical protein